MYTAENYQWGLLAYTLGVALMTPLAWKITTHIPWQSARTLTRLLYLALFFTPVYAYPDSNFLAPAWVVTLFEIFAPTSEEGMLRALVPLIMVYLGLVLLYIAGLIIRYRTNIGIPTDSNK